MFYDHTINVPLGQLNIKIEFREEADEAEREYNRKRIEEVPTNEDLAARKRLHLNLDIPKHDPKTL